MSNYGNLQVKEVRSAIVVFVLILPVKVLIFQVLKAKGSQLKAFLEKDYLGNPKKCKFIPVIQANLRKIFVFLIVF